MTQGEDRPGVMLEDRADCGPLCGRAELDPRDRLAIVNPVVVFEVLSESTEAFDRGAKFAHYRHLPSLKEHVFVAIEDRRVEHYRRMDGGQSLLTEVVGSDARVALPALGIEVPLADIFEKLELLAQKRSV